MCCSWALEPSASRRCGRRRSARGRSEEHTSELQSRLHLVCRLLLEKKNKILLIGLSPAQAGGHPTRLTLVARIPPDHDALSLAGHGPQQSVPPRFVVPERRRAPRAR